MDFKSLRKICAKCENLDYNKCRQCKIHSILNTPCDFCGKIGGVVPFIHYTKNGLKKFMVCERCLRKLT